MATGPGRVHSAGLGQGLHLRGGQRSARALEELADQPTPLDRHHLPAGRGEHALQPFDLDVGHHPV
jgi:hypothetical protein